MRTFLKPLSFIPALLLMYMIFSFSGQSGDVSSQLSFQVSRKIVEAGDYIFDANLEEWQIDEWAGKIHFITRKLAHMTEYFALAVAVSFPLYVYGMHGILLMLTAGIICVGFACGDEYHQSFVSGRSPSMKDVAIDSIGIFFGIIVVRIIGWTGRKTIFRPKVKKVRQSKGKQPHMKAPKIKNKNKNVTYQNGPGYGTPPYQGDYPQGAPYQGQPPYQGAPPRSGYPPYSGPGMYQGTPPYSEPYQNGPAYQRQPPYSNGSSGQGQPCYPPNRQSFENQDMPFSNDPYVNPNYRTPPYPGTPYPGQDTPSYGSGPYTHPEDPYQNPDFTVQPPDEEWMQEAPSSNRGPRKKKKKEKDWFFDM